MKPHPRIRKTVKWGGLVLTVLLVVVWIGSGWISVSWLSRRGTGLSLYTGRLGLGYGIWRDFPVDEPEWHFAQSPWMMQWWFEGEPKGAGWALAVPIWALAGFALVGTAVAWRRDALARRRARKNFCPACHYDRTGLAPSAPCPECNSPAPPANA